ncbi:MAG: hypothetical protein ACKVQS_04460 [Fimbriimonadaceae bacterium]
MRNVAIALITLAALTACSPPVKVEKKLDGSTTTTLKTDGGEIKIDDKNGTSQIKDKSGFEMNTKTDSDGSVAYNGKNSKGENFQMQSGKELDLTEFGIEPYPGAEAKNANASFRTETSQGISASLALVTKDSAAKVIEFYSSKFVDNKTTSTTNNMAMIGGKTANGSSVYITALEENGETQIGYTCNSKAKN